MKEPDSTWDVVIAGAGPVGLVLANLLGLYGVRTLVLERNEALENEPRAVTLDDESLRTIQNMGLVEVLLPDIVLGYGVQYFDWRGKPLAAIQPNRQEYGYPKRNAFRQPDLLRVLLNGLGRFAHVHVQFGYELVAVSQNDDAVACEINHFSGTHTVRAHWLVGCDGGRSTVRQLCRIPLQGDTYPQRWLIIDLARRTVPLRHTHTYCDPKRATIRLPGPHASLRYEFMLHAHDRDDDVLQEHTFRHWIAERMPQDAALPLVRKAIYGFHARVASRWQQGRILLAGDAAHLSPPFAGQGLNSGLRDASNLAWKLAAVVRRRQAASLLESYEIERRPHAQALIQMALRIGLFMQPNSMAGAILAQTALRLACLLPVCRDYILQLRFKPKPLLKNGYFCAGNAMPNSILLPQPMVENSQRQRVLLDVCLGDGFAVIGRDGAEFRAWAISLHEDTCRADRLLPADMPVRMVAVLAADEDFINPGSDSNRVRDVSGTLLTFLRQHDAAALIVRPDRYVYRVVQAHEMQS